MAITIDMRGELLPNSSSPIFASNYKDGNRPAGGELVASANWTDGVLTPSPGPGGSWNVYAGGASTAAVVSNALRFTYPANAESNGLPGLELDVSSLNTRELYIEFKARIPNAKWGLKLLKIFGKITSTNSSNDTYSNCTFGVYYSTAEMESISYGDGTDLSNDTQCTVSLVSPQIALGPRNGSATVSTPKNSTFDATDWGTSWHTIRAKVKFNDGTTEGTQVQNGEFYLEIDGEVYVVASGLFNRSWQSDTIWKVAFGDWTQGANPLFNVDFDDIVISRYGFMS